MSSLRLLSRKYKGFCQCLKVKLAENKSETNRQGKRSKLNPRQLMLNRKMEFKIFLFYFLV